MHETRKKEEFSIAYTHAVASAAGFAAEPIRVDLGKIDMAITGFGYQGSYRTPELKVQLKCTSQKSVLRDDNLHFRLDVDTYDELRAEHLIPRLLLVVIVPEDPSRWVSQTEEQLIMRSCGYCVPCTDTGRYPIGKASPFRYLGLKPSP